MHLTPQTLSHALTLDEVLARLAARPAVEGLALFGSRAGPGDSPVSDYDLLILVSRLPIGIFQMLTHIDGRMADVVFVTLDLADQVLAGSPVPADTNAGRFLLKMQTAQIVYDASGRLARAQTLARSAGGAEASLSPPGYAAEYADWFWHNHGLYHLKRMLQSADPVYLTAVDLMLLQGLGGVLRVHFRARHWPWEGEKAAIRRLQDHDPTCLRLLRECLAAGDRAEKVRLYEKLVAAALAPLGDLWQPGLTAVVVDPPAETPAQLDTALQFWESLLSPVAESAEGMA